VEGALVHLMANFGECFVEEPARRVSPGLQQGSCQQCGAPKSDKKKKCQICAKRSHKMVLQ